MTRKPRHIVPDQPHHIIHRGNNRCSTFLDAEDVHQCMFILGETSAKYDCKIHAYVLMTNHLHLLLTPDSERGPAKFIQCFAQRYARYFNYRYRRTGALWEHRYFSEWIDSEHYFFACARYIEMNPVRANMVGHPSDYTASSFRRNALGYPDALVTPHHLYQSLAPTEPQRASSYHAIFQSYVDGATPEDSRDDGTKRPWRWP